MPCFHSETSRILQSVSENFTYALTAEWSFTNALVSQWKFPVRT